MPSATAPRLLPLRARDQVVLRVDELPASAATVVAVAPDRATLVLEAAALPARMLHRRHAVMERAQDGRLFRGQGRLAMAMGAGGRAMDDTVVFHFGVTQRRAQERTAAVLPVTVVPMDAPVSPARALTIDISPGGALVRSPAVLERGHEVQLHLQLPTEELPIPAAGAVVRRTPEGLLGVRLDRMRPADRDLVERWMRDQRRQAA